MKELVLYIKLNEDELKDKRILNSIRKYLPIRKEKSRRGKKPTIASKNQGDKWYWPKWIIGTSTKKRLIGIGLGLAVKCKS